MSKYTIQTVFVIALGLVAGALAFVVLYGLGR